MTEFTVKIPDGQISFFKNLIIKLGYDFLNEKEKDASFRTKEINLSNLKNGVNEMKLINTGKLKSRNAEDLLNEL